jgi:superfamily II DNA or RNA helicase
MNEKERQNTDGTDYQAAYEALLKKYCDLEEENRRLRALLGRENVEEGKENTTQKVTMRSDPSTKIALFRSLFHGREDVYAKRWVSETTGKSGYSPVCENEWDGILCDKRKQRCSDCKNRKLQPLTDGVIAMHLKGKSKNGADVIGIYPLTADECCYFVAVDFDEKGWKKDISAFFSVCKQRQIPVAVERSRSGNGGHAWIFFTEKIAASKARRLATALLTQAMEEWHGINFSSYDRLFPNQDIMPKGGFGNLIALPLQGLARLKGNSVFIDGDFIPYSDQWAYLSSIQRLSKEQIDEALTELKGEELGELETSEQSKEEKPWKKRKNLSIFDFPVLVKITIANMIYIEKKGFSEYAMNCVKRLAAFKNPEFYKAQKLRLPVYNKPRIIATHEETDEYIALPRGCMDDLTAMLNDFSVTYETKDERNYGMPINVKFSGTLRAEQIPAFQALANEEFGVLSATTAFGKTVIGGALIAEKGVNVLILVHTAALLDQWKKALSKFLLLQNELPSLPKGRGRKKAREQIGQLGATKNTLNGFVDIAILQSLFDGDEVKEFVKDYGMVIVDECHHVPAISFEKVMKAANARFVYGLTATPTRQDGHQAIIFMQCGKIRYRVDAEEQAKKHGFSHTVIPRFTSFCIPLSANGSPAIQTILNQVCESKTRNDLIVNDGVRLAEEGKNVIVLTERKTHAELLAKEIAEKGIKTYLLIGAESAKTKREKLSAIANAAENDRYVIVATGKYVGEGFDEARLDTLLLAMPISWKGKLAQYAGRLHRQYKGKNEVIIYDYVDINVGVLEGMYHKRMVGYRAIGYEISVVEKGKKTGILFDNTTYLPVFSEDILSAKEDILLVCPILRKKQTVEFLSLLSRSAGKPSVRIVTGRGNNIRILVKTGIKVEVKDGLRSKFAVIDSSLIWYGNIGFLSGAEEEETSLRFSNEQTARELSGVLDGNCGKLL